MIGHKSDLLSAKKLLVILTLVAVIVLPLSAHVLEEDGKLVRVGWYDSTYNTIDEKGFRSGYAYEYQLKLSAYNGWKYEYVSGSWADLLHMLETGEIDLMSDVSYTPEREKKMLYPSYPMGSEEYYLFVAPGNSSISALDPLTLNGKRVGVNMDSIQAQFYEEWEKDHNVKAQIILLSTTEEESLRMLENGELDAYVTVDSFMDPTRAVPVFKVGSSDYYFAVTKGRPDLLEELNMAMSLIEDENRYYNIQMYEKYIRRSGANAFLSAKETEWYVKHGPIRVGYQDNYLAFCAQDRISGNLTGVLRDFLNLASDCMPNAHIDFIPAAYPTAEDAMTALRNGEVDCVFPANLSGYEAEQQGTVMSPPLMDTEMYVVVRAKDPNIFSKEGKVIVAVNVGNPNYEAFLAKHYPSWQKAYYSTSEDCLKAIASGDADCLVISNYRYNNIARLCEKYHLTTISIGIEMDYCFAIEKGQTELYSILAKIISIVPDSSIIASLSHYIAEDSKVSFSDILAENLLVILIIATVIVVVILLLLLQNMRAVRIANSLISATETDDLTGLLNRKFFFQYANRIYREHSNTPMDAIVINIEQFHSVNALHGRELGNVVLRRLGNEIRDISREKGGIAGRFEADRFDIYCRHTTDYQAILDRLQGVMDSLVPNANILLRMGVMPYQAKVEPMQLFDRARTACNMARGHYKKHLIIYDETVSARESYEQRLRNDLRHALDAKEFEVYYQPKYNIQSEKPTLVGAEALVRWHHPDLGLVSPGDFIPILEKNGQISLLDKYVWAEAASQIALWRDRFGVSVPVSVNLSRVDVFDPALEETLDGILATYKLDHNLFKLEVTESAYTENADQVIQVVGGLRNKGYKVEMDDFGTGYSSLNMLSSMPIDVLKLDREFIRNIENEEKDRQLVILILDIAKNLKVPVIAEGVETDVQLQYLKKMGCSMVQGFYFSRPLPADEFEKKYFNETKGGQLQ